MMTDPRPQPDYQALLDWVRAEGEKPSKSQDPRLQVVLSNLSPDEQKGFYDFQMAHQQPPRYEGQLADVGSVKVAPEDAIALGAGAGALVRGAGHKIGAGLRAAAGGKGWLQSIATGLLEPGAPGLGAGAEALGDIALKPGADALRGEANAVPNGGPKFDTGGPYSKPNIVKLGPGSGASGDEDMVGEMVKRSIHDRQAFGMQTPTDANIEKLGRADFAAVGSKAEIPHGATRRTPPSQWQALQNADVEAGDPEQEAILAKFKENVGRILDSRRRKPK